MFDFEWLDHFGRLHGQNLFIASVIILIIAIGLTLRYYLPSGESRLKATEKQRIASRRSTDNQLDHQRQLYESHIEKLNYQHEREKADLRAQHERERSEDRAHISALQERVRLLEERMNASEIYNREYRHALANREHVIGFAYDNSLQLLDIVLEQYPDIAPSFKRQRQYLKTADQLRANIPLPESPREEQDRNRDTVVG